MRDELKIFGWIALAVVVVGIGLWSVCQGHDHCIETVGGRPCIQNTIEYDWDDGECECQSEYGEIEWEIGRGCGGF